jgi:hypothetical protein
MNIIHELSDNYGFYLRYKVHLLSSKTQYEAYDKTENEYFILFGKRKYSNWNSFRQIKMKYTGTR